MALIWHAFSPAPQEVQKSFITSIFLSFGIIHAFDGQTLKHPWQPTGSQPLSFSPISSISPSNGFVTFAASYGQTASHQPQRVHLLSSTLIVPAICLLYTSDAADDLLCVDLG